MNTHLVNAIEANTTANAARLAIGFALQVLPIFEKRYPSDQRPRQALQAARDYLDGKIEMGSLKKAHADAADAAIDASAAYCTDAELIRSAVRAAYYANDPARAAALAAVVTTEDVAYAATACRQAVHAASLYGFDDDAAKAATAAAASAAANAAANAAYTTGAASAPGDANAGAIAAEQALQDVRHRQFEMIRAMLTSDCEVHVGDGLDDLDQPQEEVVFPR